MQYSPKLKVAMAEINAIIEKHDIGGMVILHEPGFAEFKLNLSPSYSAVKTNGDEIRLKSNAEMFGGDKEKQMKVLEDSINLLDLMSSCGGNMTMTMIELLELVKKKVDFIRTDRGFSSGTTQNN